jgi:hypothetical protein
MQASAQISEAQTSLVSRYSFELTITQPDGTPVAGSEAVAVLEGDGSFAPNFSSKEIRRVTNEQGKASFVWYRRSIYGRDVKATVNVSTVDESLSLEMTNEVADGTSGVSVSYPAFKPTIRR